MEEQKKQQLRKVQEWVRKQLVNLKDLLDTGLISEEDFEEQKQQILHFFPGQGGPGKGISRTTYQYAFSFCIISNPQQMPRPIGLS